jgi:hypothetical protein
MSRGLSRHLTPHAAAVTAPALSLGLAPAQASTPGWGVRCANPCGNEGLLVRGWNGTAWQSIAPPPGSRKDVGSAVTAVSSASDEWVFANATTASGNTYYLCTV